MTRHCLQRLSERYMLDITYQELNKIKKQIRSGNYILIEVYDGKMQLLTRYMGRYIIFVMSTNFEHLVTALPYKADEMKYIEQYIKEFDNGKK